MGDVEIIKLLVEDPTSEDRLRSKRTYRVLPNFEPLCTLPSKVLVRHFAPLMKYFVKDDTYVPVVASFILGRRVTYELSLVKFTYRTKFPGAARKRRDTANVVIDVMKPLAKEPLVPTITSTQALETFQDISEACKNGYNVCALNSDPSAVLAASSVLSDRYSGRPYLVEGKLVNVVYEHLLTDGILYVRPQPLMEQPNISAITEYLDARTYEELLNAATSSVREVTLPKTLTELVGFIKERYPNFAEAFTTDELEQIAIDVLSSGNDFYRPVLAKVYEQDENK